MVCKCGLVEPQECLINMKARLHNCLVAAAVLAAPASKVHSSTHNSVPAYNLHALSCFSSKQEVEMGETGLAGLSLKAGDSHSRLMHSSGFSAGERFYVVQGYSGGRGNAMNWAL